MTKMIKRLITWLFPEERPREWRVELEFRESDGRRARWVDDRIVARYAHEAVAESMVNCGVTPSWVITARALVWPGSER